MKKTRETQTRKLLLYLPVIIFFICVNLFLTKSIVWAADNFEAVPFATDNAREDKVFSPDASVGKQDEAIIRFSVKQPESGFDYRVTVNTYGAGFDTESDWTTEGSSSASPFEVTWNGTDRNGIKVADSRYEILVEVDKVVGNGIIKGDTGYDSSICVIHVDNTTPQISASIDKDSFSPNEDGVKDTVEISYILSEKVTELLLNIGQFSSIELEEREQEIKYSYEWNGSWYGKEWGTKFTDGEYNLIIYGTDEGGNVGRFELTVTIDTEAPAVIGTFLAERDFINSPLTEVSATVDDQRVIDFDSASTLISLKDFNGKAISGTLEYKEDAKQVILKLDEPLGTSEQNGEYSMTVQVADEAGNSAESTHSFVLDTLPPEITKVVSGESELKPYNSSVILSKSGLITVQAKDDTSGVDFSNVEISLTGPSGEPVNLTKEITLIESETYGVKLNYQGLTEEGTYVINIVSLPDRAGNRIENDTRYQFRYIISTEELPVVESITPAYGDTINSLSSISTVLKDNSGAGLNLAETSIDISGPHGPVQIVKPDQLPESGAIQLRFSSPLKIDGTDDGEYEVTVTPKDNLGQVGQPKTISFTYDTQEPELLSLSSGTLELPLSETKIYHNSPIERISAVFQDVAEVAKTSGIDFDTTSIAVEHAGSSLEGTLDNNDKDQVEFRLTNPISAANGTQDGEYTVIVDFSDEAGNSDTKTFHLVYDTQVPAISSITPEHNATVNQSGFSEITISLSDATSGVDFQNTEVSLKRDGAPVGVNVSDNGTTEIKLSFDAFATDGSDDDEYIVEITPVDLAQNHGATVTRRFFYASVAPEIELTNLADGEERVASGDLAVKARRSVNDISEISAQLLDYVGPGIDLDQSTVTVTKKGAEEPLPATAENDENLSVTWKIDSPLPHDGTADGAYIVDVSFIDQNSKFEDSFELRFDTQIPTVNTTPAAKSQVSSLNQVTIQLTDVTSKIDLSATEANLISPSGQIATQKLDNGNDLITLQFDQLKTDGTQDGIYRIEVLPADSAGNAPSEPKVIEFSYLSQKPEITLNVDEYTNQLNVIEAQLSEYSGPSIDFDASTITTTSWEDNELAGELVLSDGNSLRWEPVSFLLRDGSADGEYTVDVDFVDSFGNSHAESFKVKFDTQVPTIRSTVPEKDTRVTELSQIKVTLKDNLSGVDFTQTNVSLMGPAGPVEATKTNDSESITLSFTRLAPEQNGGVYTIEVVPVDLASNSGGTNRVEFVLAPAPEIAEISPADGSIVNSVSSIEAHLTDYSGEGIDFGNSQITLSGEDEVVFDLDEEINLVSARMSDDDESTLRLDLNLPTDGTADGKYTVGLHIADKLDTATDYTRTFVYDSQPPTATLISPEDTTVSKALPTIELEALDPDFSRGAGSGVNLVDSEIRLSSDHGEIAGEQTSSGNKFTFVPEEQLPQTGKYTIEAALADRAGNSKTYRYEFDYVIVPPQVVLIIEPEAVGQGSRLYVNSLEKVTVKLKDNSGTGLDFSSTGSDVEILGPDGSPLGGVKTHDGDNLIFSLTTLLDREEGTDDGIYTVTVTPVDNTGTAGTPQNFSLVYDTQEPEITSLSHVELFEDISYVSAEISKFSAVVSDEGGSDIDFDNSVLSLAREDGTELPGTLNTNETDTIWFSLDTPLSRDGSADGSYTVGVQIYDKAGNEFTKTYPIIYDTTPPTASLSITENEAVITETTNQIDVKIEDTGVNLSASSVELVGPNGEAINANKSDNGVDTLIYTFAPLRQDGTDDGTYLVNVTSVDKAGNSSQNQFRFFYIAKGPETISTTPAGGDYVAQLDTVSVTFSREIDLNSLKLTLLSPSDGDEVPGTTKLEGTTLLYKLDEVLPTNGSEDGEYTINITSSAPTDSRLIYQQKFIYDTQIPEVASVTPAISEDITIKDQLVSIGESFSEFTVKLTDALQAAQANAEAKISGLDLAGTQVQFMSPDGVPINGNKRNNGIDELTYSFPTLAKVGTYTIQVTPRDMAGNTSEHPIEFRFSLDFERPVVKEVSIAGKTPSNYTTSLSSISATIEDRSGTGIDLAGSTIRVSGPQGEVEGVHASDVETNMITWKPVFLATDGSDDGTYSITVQPVDNADRSGTQRRYTVVYDTQEPEVTSVYPLDLSSSVTYVSQQIRHVEATIMDTGPSEIEIEDQRISLKGGVGGNTVAGILTDDGDQRVIWTLESPLATDGSDDGEYSVSLYVQDQAGNAKELEYNLVYDTQAPQVLSTTPGDKEVVRTDVKTIEVRVEDPGDSMIDFDASRVELIDPKGNKIAAKEQTNNGLDTITLRIDGLETDGTHTIRIYAVDRAGNGSDTPIEKKFLYSTSTPVIVSTTPKTIPAEVAYVNELAQVEVTLKEVSDGGIDFSSTGSEIRLLDNSGNVVPGTQKSDESNEKIIWELATPLATDGSEDGNYTITVVPVNAAGRRGEMKTFSFFYDAVAPEVENVTLKLSDGTSNSLSTVVAEISDDEPSSKIDWDDAEAADEAWIKLVNSSGKEYPGSVQVASEVSENSAYGRIMFKLREPLASDGSQDDTYTAIVTPLDKAGNSPEPTKYEFVYDTEAPTVDPASLTIDDKPLLYDTSDPDYPTPTNSKHGVTITAKVADTGLGTDLAQSTIVVASPQGAPVSGKVTHNGVDTLRLTTGLLPEDGIYQVTVNAVGLDDKDLGIRPSSSLSTTFLLETTDPTATLTDYGTKTTLEEEELPMQGTAIDPQIPETGIPASGVALVEVGGLGPDDERIAWVPAKDDSKEEEEAWSSWSLDFLPAKSGEYELQIRVTDEAGNSAVFDAVDVDFTVSLGFKDETYVWPNPVSRSKGDEGHFSFNLNIPDGAEADVTLYIYDVAGDLVYKETYSGVEMGRNDQIATWNLRNAHGDYVASGIYAFRLEAENGSDKIANVVGRILVVR